MSRTTIYLSRLMGLFAIVFAVSLVLHHELANLLFTDRTLLLMLGMLAVAAGLAMVLSHNVWSGGAAGDRRHCGGMAGAAEGHGTV